jgi:membrane-associated phospholipid phosphatase
MPKCAILALFAALLVAAAFLADHTVDQFVQAHQNPHLLTVAHTVSKYGDWPFLVAIGILVLAFGPMLGRPAITRLGLALALCACLGGLSATVIRSVTGRTRPSAKVPQGWYGIRHDSQWLIGQYQYNSFPSGHTGAAVGFAVPLFLGTRRGKIPAVLLGLIMAWSRVYLECHHLSDVTVAALLGMAFGLATWRWLLSRMGGA